MITKLLTVFDVLRGRSRSIEEFSIDVSVSSSVSSWNPHYSKPGIRNLKPDMFRAAFRRLLAIDDPPERTALAFSIGVFIAFSPFLGLHTIMATLVAFVFRFNKIAIYAGTFINNPFLDVGTDNHCFVRGGSLCPRSPIGNSS